MPATLSPSPSPSPSSDSALRLSESASHLLFLFLLPFFLFLPLRFRFCPFSSFSSTFSLPNQTPLLIPRHHRLLHPSSSLPTSSLPSPRFSSYYLTDLSSLGFLIFTQLFDHERFLSIGSGRLLEIRFLCFHLSPGFAMFRLCPV